MIKFRNSDTKEPKFSNSNTIRMKKQKVEKMFEIILIKNNFSFNLMAWGRGGGCD